MIACERAEVTGRTAGDALGVLAQSSTRWNAWAADRYASARARGHSHRRALRTLGRVESDHLALLADPHPV